MDIFTLGEKLDARETGNKAAFLSLMKHSGFNVPGGIVLGKNIFVETMSSNAETEKLLHSLTPENAKETSEKLTQLYSGACLPEQITAQIAKLTDPDKNYAVRSSGIKEDLEGFSFAGQYDTFINISGAENIAKAVIRCYLSAFSETVLSYLAVSGLTAENTAMAVVIQEMVDSEISGVAFTVNPMTGNDKEICAEVTQGQGENLVSGKVAAESYHYDWWNEKTTLSGGQLLSEDKLKELADTALKIQQFFGYPCDIEFAYEAGRLYILQARAITRILYSGIKDQWTTADFKDGGVSATVCTPYMWSLYEYIWENELRKFLIESKILKASEIDKKLGEMFYGRPYWNLTVVKAAMAKVPGYKEKDFDSELGVRITYEGNGTTTSVNPKTIYGIIKMAIGQRKIVRERRENAEKLRSDLLSKYSVYFAQKEDKFSPEQIRARWKQLIFDDYLMSESTYFRQIFINTIHQSLYKDKILKHTTQGGYFTLIGGLDNISHLLPFYDMWDISRDIRKDEKALAYWKNTPAETISAELSKAPFGDRLLAYIDKFGYHSKKELDVTYPSFYEDIPEVVSDLKNTCELDDVCSPQADAKRLDEDFKKEMAGIKAKISASKYKKVEKTVKEMRKMLWWREEFRDVSTRFYCIIRAYTVRLAQSLCSEGIISEENDIWFTKIEDVRSFIDGKIDKEELGRIIKRNKIYYDCFRNYTNENEIGSSFDNSVKKKTSGSLSGIGCSCFKATGTARVIHSLDETDRLQQGDILITRFTDTGWTGKFAMLSGIVTEYGGILCHAAIVSREYGIPCVVCAESATKLIKDGDVITINGETGEIITGVKK